MQKYRLYLSRLQKQNEGCGSGGNYDLNCSSSIRSESGTTKYTSPTENFQTQGIVPSVHVGETKKIEPAPSSDVPCAAKANNNNVSNSGVLLSFEEEMPNFNKACEPTTSKYKFSLDAIPTMQLSQCSCLTYVDREFDTSFGQYPSTLQPFVSTTHPDEKDVKDLFQMKPVLTDYRNGHFTAIPPMTCKIDSVSLRVKRGSVNAQDIGAICKLGGSTSLQDCYINDKHSQGGCLPLTYGFSLKSDHEPETDSLPEDVHLCSVQKIGRFESLGFDGTEIYRYADSTMPTTEVESNWYLGPELNGECSYDQMDYPLMDEYLFA